MRSLSFLAPSSLPRLPAGLLFLLLALGLAAMACVGGAPSDKEVLVAVTDDVVVPAYRQLAADAADLDDNVVSLCSSSSATALEETRQA